MLVKIVTVIFAGIVVVVARHLFNKRKMNSLEFIAYVLGVAGGSLMIIERKGLFGIVGIVLFCSWAIIEIIEIARKK